MPAVSDKRQFGRFAVVGTVNTMLDFGLLFLLKGLGLPIVTANIISSGTAFVVSFIANKKFTFKSIEANVLREMILFVIVTLFGLWVLQTIVIQLSLPFFGAVLGSSDAGLLAAKLVATVVSLAWNYVLYAKVVFRKSDNAV